MLRFRESYSILKLMAELGIVGLFSDYANPNPLSFNDTHLP